MAGYERLRERVLAGRPDGWRLGHGVLAGKGVAAWIAACTAFTAAPAVPAARPANVAVVATGAGHGGADQLVAVLAEMALAHTCSASPLMERNRHDREHRQGER